MDQSLDWQLYKTFPHTSTIGSAYFDNNQKIFDEELLITCSPNADIKVNIFGLSSGNNVFAWDVGDDTRTFCLDSTGYLFMYSRGSVLTNFLPYFFNEKGPDVVGSFTSCLPIAPNHLSFHKSDTTAGTAARVIEKLLYIYDMNTKKDIYSFAHENPIKDCCFHPRRNIIASITTPDTCIRIIDIAARKAILTIPSYKTSYSIRFDETGNRLALTNDKTIDVLDISNLNHPQTLFSIDNTFNGTQACLNDKYLAVAFTESIKLFNVDTKQEIANFAGNNDLSSMNCFDPTGNFIVILNGSNALIYKKTVSSSAAAPLAITSAASANQDQILDRDIDYCCMPTICNKELKKSLASIMTFFQNQLS